MEDKLLPCPFCGDRGIRRTIKWKTIEPSVSYIVECRNKKCFVNPSTFLHYPKSESMKEAISRWNTRKES